MEPPDRGSPGISGSRWVWVVVGVAMFGLVVAASSDSVRVWTNPEPSGSDASVVVDAESPPRTGDEQEGRSQPAWVGDVLRALATSLFAAVLIGGVFAIAQAKPSARKWRWRSMGRPAEPFAPPLPDAVDRVVRVDAGAARTALQHGPPRNAIVACWMQFERDAAATGTERRPAETSGEYVERVVGRASVDPAPIGELATLYREARFSAHELGPEHIDRAAATLDRVVAALRVEAPA